MMLPFVIVPYPRSRAWKSWAREVYDQVPYGDRV